MIDLNDITIGQAKQLVAMIGGNAPEAATAQKKLMIGEYVIVRCRDAGVHAGMLIDYEGRTVLLSHARRLWRWQCNQGISLSAVATHGLDHSKSRVADEITVVLADACEIIAVTEGARRSIQSAPVAEQS